MSLIDPALYRAGAAPAFAGVTLAKVKQTNDPKGLGRITVIFQVDGNQIESDWLQVMSFYGGPDYGAFFLPHQDESVLVAFADGDIDQPYVLGLLWNGGIKPPVVGAEKQQDVRLIKTRQGKQLIFDDSQSGQLTLIDEKQNKVQIDTANNHIRVESKGDISVTATGTLTLQAAEVVIRNTAGTVKLDLAAATLQVNGGQNIKMSATMIELN
ncbi:Rhs element Vgr protein [Chitinimonas arctica]|uniref:Rhs element Vgr protein n=1 Tax=Chitinimonas arctica TaxID=2594795 RepID=A0A516SIN1_9NEIS|nr:phage baseplate assembly protein V [Chitinimonas arctica]QDQ28001.1 Rhs element Vgr protein [Chitinimonas arctica]